MKNDTVNNVVSWDRCLKKYSRLYKKYPGYAHGVVPAFRADFSSEQNRELQLKIKTDLIRLGYSVTTAGAIWKVNFNSAEQYAVNTQIFLVFERSSVGLLQYDLITLGRRYGLELVAFSPCAGRNLCLYRNGGSAGGTSYDRPDEYILSLPLFDDCGSFIAEIPDSPFAFTSIADDALSFDCVKTSYGISTIMMLAKVPGFVLKE